MRDASIGLGTAAFPALLCVFIICLLLGGCPGNQGEEKQDRGDQPAGSTPAEVKDDAAVSQEGAVPALPQAGESAAEGGQISIGEQDYGDPMQPQDELAKQRLEALGYLTGSSGSYKPERALEIFERLAGAGDPYSIMYVAVVRRYHFKENDYKLPDDFVDTSLNAMSALAEAGEPEAQYIVARYMYTFRYPDTAHIFYRYARESADKGFHPAAGYLGYLFTTTLREGPKFDEAARWLTKAAEYGQADAMYHLGYTYGQPQWEGKDPGRAVEWFERSAEREYPWAYWALGWCYESGSGVRQDYKEALAWYEKGAAAGNGESLYSLAMFYLHGREVKQDTERARDLLEQALNAGVERAQKELDSLAGRA